MTTQGHIRSMNKAVEMGTDWWTSHPCFTPSDPQNTLADALNRNEQQLSRLEDTATGN